MLSQLGAIIGNFDLFTIMLMVCGVFGGLIIGALPGLTSTMAVALLVPITYGMDVNHGLILLVSVYIGGIAGGLVSASLLNIPGTPASVATTFDAYPMAKKGLAGTALSYGVFSAFLGGIFSFFCLVLLAPPLSTFALDFGPCEYFSLVLFTLSCIVSISHKSLIKGFISAALGLLLSCVGLSETDGMPRFDFGIADLQSGFSVMPVLIGMFAVSQILIEVRSIREPYTIMNATFTQREFWRVALDVLRQWKNVIRSAFIGTGIGILPGVGPGLSNIVAYSQAKAASKEPETFGTGNPNGIIASEVASCASTGGAMIPLLTLGIPGDAVTAMLLGGLQVHNVAPGPLIYEKNGAVVYAIFFAMGLSAIFMMVFMLFGMRLFVSVLKIPKNFLLPVIIVLCGIGAIGNSNNVFDTYSMVAFGLMSYLLIKSKIPTVPMILGFILGPMFEENLRRVSQLSSSESLFSHPISCVFIVVTVIVVIFSVRANRKDALRAQQEELAQMAKLKAARNDGE